MLACAGAIQAPVVKESEFPSLGAAAAVKETKKKKKQTMSLGEFVTRGTGGPPKADLLMNLPTAPRVREPGEEEPERPLGGGFKGYGGAFIIYEFKCKENRGCNLQTIVLAGQRSGGRFGDDRPPRREREDMPSRADAVDDWGAGRKFESSRSEPRGGRGFGDGPGFGGGARDEPSRADLVDDWGSSRQPRERDGFSDRRSFPPRGRRDGSYERGPSRADVEEKWGHRSDVRGPAMEDRPRRGPNETWRGRERGFSSSNSRDGSQDGNWRNNAPEERKERPKLNLKPRSKPVESAEPAVAEESVRSSVFGAARPREEVLKCRPEETKDEETKDESIEEKVKQVDINDN